MTIDSTPTTQVSATAAQAGQPSAGEASAPPPWFAAYTKAQDERFKVLESQLDRRFEGFREKHLKPAGATDTGDGVKKVKRLTNDDLLAAMRVGELKSQISNPDARRRVEEVAQTRGFAAAAEFADDLLRLAPAPQVEAPKGAGSPSDAAPRGLGATAGQSSANYPRSLADLLKLASSDPMSYRRLRADANFDITSLPQM